MRLRENNMHSKHSTRNEKDAGVKKRFGGRTLKFEGESIGENHRGKKDLNLSEKTDILVAGKGVTVCV